eukprot:3891898-Amphidinium_carterae.1
MAVPGFDLYNTSPHDRRLLTTPWAPYERFWRSSMQSRNGDSLRTVLRFDTSTEYLRNRTNR